MLMIESFSFLGFQETNQLPYQRDPWYWINFLGFYLVAWTYWWAWS